MLIPSRRLLTALFCCLVSAAIPGAAQASSSAGATQRVVQVQGFVNTHDPTYGPALTKYQTDPFRSRPWAGEDYAFDLFEQCPQGVHESYPEQTFRFRSGKLAVRFTTNPPQYCDLVGTQSEHITAWLRRSRHSRRYRRIGSTVIYTVAMREILMQYGLGGMLVATNPYVWDTVTLPRVGNLCPRGRASHAFLRVKVIQHFTANPKQTFQRNHVTGRSDDMRSEMVIYRSGVQDACAPPTSASPPAALA